MPNTREKLIELICKSKSMVCDAPTGECSKCQKLADHLIANGVTVQKWIPVTERLPELFGTFIVAVKEGTGNSYSDYADYDPYQQKWRTGLMLGRMDEVTHWMPLPEPPKGE